MRRPRFLFACLLSSFATFWGAPSYAQINPDQTLGAESSIVTPDIEVRGKLADVIEGGAIRGGNLFHSFTDFNVLESERVYFANPANIDSILSRVTGNNLSNIFGTLGVDGTADLFLINPIGIIFGPDVNLDVEGSFYATTGEAVSLGEGVFSATTPEQSELLVVNPDAAFFRYLTTNSGDIVNRGQIGADGDVTLAGNYVDLQGQIAAGQNLSLLAADTLQIRDTAELPFVAFAGDSLLAQGNQRVDIEALSRSESGLFSYGDMVLRSAEPIGGDTHYLSGGSFRVEQLNGSTGDLFSPIDPIIRSVGDVEIGQYQGSSLHIIAGGAVRIGTAVITSPDIDSTGLDSLRETLELSDGTSIGIDGGIQPTLDVRAGVDPSAVRQVSTSPLTGFDNLTDILIGGGTSDTPSNADISIKDIIVQSPNGLVLLTNQYLPNSQLSTGNISIESQIMAANDGRIGGILASPAGGGGTVILDARDNITVTGSLITTVPSDISQGNVVLLAGHNVQFDSPTGRASGILTGTAATSLERGGNIRVSADNLLLSDGSRFFTGAFGSQNLDRKSSDAGNIVINASETILIEEGSQLGSTTLTQGNAGNISLTAGESISFEGVNVMNGQLLARSGINTSIGQNSIQQGMVSRDTTTGSAGQVTINTNFLSLSNGALISSIAFNQGNASNVILNASGAIQIIGNYPSVRIDQNGNSRIQALPSGISTSVAFGSAGIGGSIEISSDSLLLDNKAQISSTNVGDRSNSSNPSRGSDITIRTNRAISLLDGSGIRTNSTARRNSGNISLIAGEDIVIEGGDPIIENSPVRGGVSSSIATGEVFLEGENNNIVSAGNIIISADSFYLRNGAVVESETGAQANAGNITIAARDAVSIEGNRIFSQLDEEGNVVRVPLSSLVSTSVRSGGRGQGGDISITANSLTLDEAAVVSTSTSGLRGENGRLSNAGSINIEIDDDVDIKNGAQVSSSTLSPGAQGNAGNIALVVGGDVRLYGSSIIEFFDSIGTSTSVDLPSRISTGVDSQAVGSGGDLSISATNFYIEDGARLSAENLGQGNSGSIDIGARNLLQAQNGTISTRAISGTGGRIQLSAGTVVLRNNSDLQTFVGFGGNEGGRITVLANALVALDDSDILTFSADGTGGNIDLSSTTLFSDPLDPISRTSDLAEIAALLDNDEVNFNASGLVSEGEISINNTNIIENELAELPENFVSTDSLVSNSCISRNNSSEGSLALTGNDRLPQAPNETTSAAYPAGTVQPIPTTAEMTQSITEPQSIYQLADGRLLMNRDCEQ